MRRLLSTLLAISLLLTAPGAWAWDDPHEVVHGSARVLERGETLVGILSPLGYGLHERITLFTHPALLLLLIPNIWTRASLLDGDTALALEFGYQQSLLLLDSGDDDESDPGEEAPTPGYFQAGLVFSQVVGRSLQLNAALGYLVHFGEFTTDLEQHNQGLYWRVGAHLLVKQVNLILAEVRGNWLDDSADHYPTGTLLFARQLGRTRIGLGAAFGDFPISTNFASSSDPKDTTTDGRYHLAVYPWVDVWWRF